MPAGLGNMPAASHEKMLAELSPEARATFGDLRSRDTKTSTSKTWARWTRSAGKYEDNLDGVERLLAGAIGDDLHRSVTVHIGVMAESLRQSSWGSARRGEGLGPHDSNLTGSTSGSSAGSSEAGDADDRDAGEAGRGGRRSIESRASEETGAIDDAERGAGEPREVEPPRRGVNTSRTREPYIRAETNVPERPVPCIITPSNVPSS